MVVRELITKLGFSVNTAQIKNAERATDRLRDGASRAADAFRGIVAAIAGFASLRSVIGIADEMQNIRSRIAQLPQTVGDASAAFDEVANRASAAGVKIDAYAALYTKVGNAAKDYIETQSDLLTITDTISKALVVGGASAQEASAVMTQFSQALASGVLQGDEFRSMAEAAPQYLDKLSEVMGLPREQLKKLAADGRLTSRAVIEATMKMADYFDDRFKSMPMTVGGALTVVGNRFARMIDRMNRESNLVSTIAGVILAAFDGIESGVNRLVNLFDGWGNLIRFVGIAIGVAFGAKAIAALAALNASVLLAMLPFIKIISVIGAVALAIEDLYVWITGGESLIGGLIGPWSEWRDYVTAAIDMVSDGLASIGRVVGGLAAILVGSLTFDPNLISEGANGAFTELVDSVSTLASYAGQSFAAIIGHIVNYVTYGFNVAYTAAVGVFGRIRAVVVGAFESAKNAISGAFDYMRDVASNVITVISDAFNRTFNGVKQAISDAFIVNSHGFSESLGGLSKILTETFSKWGDMIYDAVFNPIVSSVRDAFVYMKDKIGGLGDMASSAWKSVKNIFVSGDDGVNQGTQNINPSQFSSRAIGAASSVNVSSNTTVNVSVPEGTTSDQASYLKRVAQQSFSKNGDDRLARDLAIYAP